MYNGSKLKHAERAHYRMKDQYEDAKKIKRMRTADRRMKRIHA